MPSQNRVVVRIEDARFGFGPAPILDGFALTLHAGEIAALMGPSGSGKTTLLRLIAGIERLAGGTLSIDSAEDQTPLSYMLQDYDTFPWLTVRRNLALSGEQRMEVIEDAARSLGLEALLDRYPRQLSGGQSKRVALARSVLARPSLLIMDEPFGSLDVRTKMSIFQNLETMFHDPSRASLFVTHSVEEAVILADRVIVLDGPPLRIVDDFRVEAARPRTGSFLESDGFNRMEARVMQRLLGRGGEA